MNDGFDFSDNLNIYNLMININFQFARGVDDVS